ncbi:hypothetical protein A5N15_03180 [Rothia kristinae]|uniref:Uncharacterized protein n=1 Tax=Rothia kristinae TaxID=37923 RepID=A0A657IVG3_9MICC|nr:hypothetical protein A5N15_03180 [Rothia kristinae]
MWLRPFRDAIYTMPPYVSTEDGLARITAAMVAAAAAHRPRRGGRMSTTSSAEALPQAPTDAEPTAFLDADAVRAAAAEKLLFVTGTDTGVGRPMRPRPWRPCWPVRVWTCTSTSRPRPV